MILAAAGRHEPHPHRSPGFDEGILDALGPDQVAQPGAAVPAGKTREDDPVTQPGEQPRHVDALAFGMDFQTRHPVDGADLERTRMHHIQQRVRVDDQYVETHGFKPRMA